MNFFETRNGQLFAEDVALAEIAEQYGTPAYLYSRAAIESAWQALDKAFASREHLICYAVKANSNLAVLKLLADLGSGFDIVSGGELARVLAAGADANKVVFSGVGKTVAEIRQALEAGIHCFNVESEPELDRINAVAEQMGLAAPVSLRVNPDVDAQTHPYISTGLKENKFGVDINEAPRVYARAAAMAGIKVVGVDCHIGSQLTEVTPFEDALDRVLALIDSLAEQGIRLQHIDIGGGLGICYDDEVPPSADEYAQAVLARLDAHALGRELEIVMEPGRSIVGNAGCLLTTVEFLKPTEHKNFALIDAAMNDLIRPALYSGWHQVLPVQANENEPTEQWDLVGPVCETGDFLAKDRALALEAGDVLAVMSAGAYGFVMASNYNSRPRPVELLVDGDSVRVVRERESIESLWAGEQV